MALELITLEKQEVESVIQILDDIQAVGQIPNNIPATEYASIISEKIEMGSGWVRPSYRPQIYPIAQNEIKILFGIGHPGRSGYCIKIGTTGGQYKVDWGEGSITYHTNNSIAEHMFNWFDVDRSTTSRNYKMTLITISLVNPEDNIISVDFTSKPSWLLAPRWNPQAFELYIECPKLTSLVFPQTPSYNISHSFVEIFYLGENELTSCNYLLANFTNLQQIDKLWIDKCSNIDYFLYNAVSYNKPFPGGVNSKAFRDYFMANALSYDQTFPDDWTFENCRSSYMMNTTFDQEFSENVNFDNITTNFLSNNIVFSGRLPMAFKKATTGIIQYNLNFDTAIHFDLNNRTFASIDMSERSNLRGLRFVGMGASTTSINIRNTRIDSGALKFLINDLYDRTGISNGTLVFDGTDAEIQIKSDTILLNEIDGLLVAKNWVASY